MKVKELIEELQHYDPEQEVVIAYDYGDRVHTNCTDTIRTVEETPLLPSGYSPSGYRVAGEDDADEYHGLRDAAGS